MICVSMCSIPVNASVYSGALVGYTESEYYCTDDDCVKEGSPIALQVQAGYLFNDYIGLEARYGTSVKRDDGLFLDSISSGFVKLNIPVSDRTAMYGLVGYSHVQLDHKKLGEASNSDASFGMGVHYALDRQRAVVLEFVNNVSDDAVRLSTFNIGFQFLF